VDGLISGKPNYDEMSPELVQAIRDQLPNLHSDMAQLGSIQSIGFVGVGNAGEDIYIVKHEHGERYQRILPGFEGNDFGSPGTEGLER
jgi:bla regulator protein blaR1